MNVVSCRAILNDSTLWNLKLTSIWMVYGSEAYFAVSHDLSKIKKSHKIFQSMALTIEFLGFYMVPQRLCCNKQGEWFEMEWNIYRETNNQTTFDRKHSFVQTQKFARYRFECSWKIWLQFIWMETLILSMGLVFVCEK